MNVVRSFRFLGWTILLTHKNKTQWEDNQQRYTLDESVTMLTGRDWVLANPSNFDDNNRKLTT